MLDVLCLCLSHNSAQMAVLTKEQPKPVDINTVKQAECTAAWKSGYYARPQGRLPKHNARQCRKIKQLSVTKEGTEQKNQETPQFEKHKLYTHHLNRSRPNNMPTSLHLVHHISNMDTLYVIHTISIHQHHLLSHCHVTCKCLQEDTIGTSICFIWNLDNLDGLGDVFNRDDIFELEFLLAPMDVAPFLMHGKWSTTTLPIFSFFLLLVIRRNHWGLIVWEHLVLLDYSRTLNWYYTWCVGTGAGWMLTWEAARFWLIPSSFQNSEGSIVLYKTDLPSFPGLFNVLIASIIAGIFMMCWWSFWTFQYRGVIWKKEFKEGVVVWLSDGWMRVGEIGC
ncbi:17549_t:CDS:2 [Funneliformis geosporum]|uniref:17549_t:CDS:1 n=1 Tax=Funneliformis geosporum TaxID=1117311 RepID=A0A9W4SI61_9GLOM|nr:17549_t:CDS:2 [Funneliformis geosporum]